AIFGFPVPVVSGVGHETDETIADLVADLRAPTPSAAAERSSPDLHQLERALTILARTMASAARASIAAEASELEGIAVRLQRAAPSILDQRRELARVVLAMQASLERRCTTDRARFENTAARIATLDPMATLARGFAIVQEAGGKHRVISSSRKVKSGHRLAISVADGAFWAEVS
ncbi:MAG: exodeoxyribonuclease VII large subunit, partial [Tepidiformaceae bacterium]